LDLNSPQFQDVFFTLEMSELKQVIAALRRLRNMEWEMVYSHPGLNWEAVDHIKTPSGAKAYSIRLSRKVRAIGYRDGELLRLVSLHPDHDSAYK
jgi:hypothetical protein